MPGAPLPGSQSQQGERLTHPCRHTLRVLKIHRTLLSFLRRRGGESMREVSFLCGLSFCFLFFPGAGGKRASVFIPTRELSRLGL